MSAISQLRLKVAVDGAETRRFALDAPVNFLRLRQLIENLLQVQKFIVLYTDDEGEQVTIASDADLKEAIALMEEMQQKALKLVVLTQNKDAALARPVAAPAVPVVEAKAAPSAAASEQSFEEQKLSFDQALGYLMVQFSRVDSSAAQAEIVGLGLLFQTIVMRLELGESLSWDGLVQEVQANCPSITSLPCFKEDQEKLFASLETVAKFFDQQVESGLLYPVPPHLAPLVIANSDKIASLIAKVQGVPPRIQALLESFKSVVSKVESVAAPDAASAEDEKAGPSVHVGVQCDGCQVNPIVGNRYKCTACHNFDLCESCESSGVHPADHELIKFKTVAVRGGGRGFGRFGGHPHPPHHGFGGPHPHHGFGGPHGHPHQMFGAGAGRGCGGFRGERRWKNSQCPWNKRPEQREASPAAPAVVLKDGMGAQFVRDLNIEDKSKLGSGQMHVKSWSLRNDGKIDWDNTVRLVYVSGNREVLLDGQDQFEVPLLKSNETGDVSVPIVVPENQGAFKTVFRLAKNGEQFGDHIWVEFVSE